MTENSINDSTSVYTCPMHPQIIQSAPGACPICGMALEPKQISIETKPNAELTEMTFRFWICLILTIPIVILTMGMLIPPLHKLITHIPMLLSAWIQALLTTPIVLWGAWPFFKRAWWSILNKSLNMFTLIALGIGIAYFYSLIVLLFSASSLTQLHLYFESAAVITTLVLLGQVLELRGREQTGLAIKALLNLTPQYAHKIIDQTETNVLVNTLHVNDQVRVKPGERIPLDGIVISGNSTVDESMISGESMPVEKNVNTKVIGGTYNLTGSIVIRIERTGKHTLLAQIIKQVSEAQRSKAPIQKLVDVISGYFVPIVILIAIITFFIWDRFGPQPSITYALISAISVLIIACPCALGLATPMAIMVGMGRGAQEGILIKDADSIERFEKVNFLVIDKTGTLTIGKPSVQAIVSDPVNENELLFFAASLARNSEHPLSNAIVQAAIARNIELKTAENFKYHVGKGITGNIDNQVVALGNLALMQTLNIELADWQIKANELSQKGMTVIYLALNQIVVGIIAISDSIKPTAKKAIAALKKAGLEVMMLTGDNKATASAIANQLGISRYEAEVSPQDKNHIIKLLKQQGKIVAMAGDGINDAPALAEADVGIAMGNGTDIAIKSANITLVKGDLMGILRARMLSKKVMRNIRENLFLAFVYNALCIPIAAGVLYPWFGILLSPMLAAAAMSLSSFSVILNSLRLRTVNLTNN